MSEPVRTDRSRNNERGALEILEEAVQLLRHAPGSALLSYCAGTLPFVLGVLFFWTDMSSSGTARAHLIDASLGLSVLFVWMKCWQAVFAVRLRDLLMDVPPSPWKASRIVRLIAIQTAVMPWEFFVLPLALLATVPFGWCCAFFHNLSVVGSGEEDLRKTLGRAWRQASLWPGQNHRILLIVTPFALFVLLNLCAAVYLVPLLLKTFLGIETMFSMGSRFFLNTTFWLAILGLTYLCLNPLLKAAYVLRCYYGEALSSGRDLLSELGRLRAHVVRGVVLVLVFLCATAGYGAELPGKSPAAVASPGGGTFPAQLDRALAQEINRLEYTWRLPRERSEEPESSGSFLAQVLQTVGGWLNAVWQWLSEVMEAFLDWLIDHLPGRGQEKGSAWKLPGSVKLWLTVLLLAVVSMAAGLIRYRKRRHASNHHLPELKASGRGEPDLNDETILPDLLPAARWLALASDLRARGELRLALRAFFFAALADLSHRGLLRIARFKSNRDYERELERRAHAFPELPASFSENVAILERVWYGMHEVPAEAFDRFLMNLQRMTGDVQNG